MRLRSSSVLALLLVGLSACGGGSDQPDLAPPTGPTLRSLADGKILVGTAVAASPHWGNDPLADDEAYRRLLAEQYNVLVAENAMKFDQLETARGEFRWTDADRVVAFAEEHGMAVRGHTLLWHQQSGWLWDGEGNLRSGIDPADLPAILEQHVTTVVGRYMGRIAYWDVVNEAIADGRGPDLTVEETLRDVAWAKHYPTGTYQWIADAFTFAHAADPDAKLFYNDYGNESLARSGWPGNKPDHVYALVKRLVDDGVPIHGVGMQMHIEAGGYPLDAGFAEQVKRFTDLGLEVHITELDVRIPVPVTSAGLETQKRVYRELLRASLETGVTAVLTWGLDDGHSWVPGFFSGYGAALPFDEAYNAKPAFYGMQEALAAAPE
jgi:endo-1,4-beta-xylanase